jgi:molybdopterin/thiamine biosynthesis adenylyltransferase
MQLETLELENGKNVMGDYKYISGGIISIDKKKNLEELRVKLHVEMKDYVINTKTNKVTHGEKNGIMDNTYIITLERSLNNEITNCPDCGAKIKNQASQKCEFCDAILVKGASKFVMVKKETIKSGYK